MKQTARKTIKPNRKATGRTTPTMIATLSSGGVLDLELGTPVLLPAVVKVLDVAWVLAVLGAPEVVVVMVVVVIGMPVARTHSLSDMALPG